ncbi:hypothetical protein FISHEDRAFT_74235 [Fistulina hepatica ATCC 64428]|uniref:Uncharacterized protein n=1 Tax=Fistulina hepatica ATCC 64428 TaxID=1128425 RepID=A0A0D7AA77_9AGAR|nr:hypothetical protein FISHEDRAFT_74235 [Fistulina hepatica ATCC 64428]
MSTRRVPVKPHMDFQRAALAALHATSQHKTRMETFRTWLALLPVRLPADPAPEPRTFVEIRYSLFRAGNPRNNVPLISCFVTTMIEKGYGDLIWPDVHALMSAHPSQDLVMQFLVDCEEAWRAYGRERGGSDAELEYLGHARVMSLEVCLDAGWHDQLSFLYKRSEGMNIPPRVVQRIKSVLVAYDVLSPAEP